MRLAIVYIRIIHVFIKYGANVLCLVSIAGCGPPSPPANGRINNYLNGSVRSQLTYRCDTGYLPHEQMVSTCMSNGSWIPTPHCVLAGMLLRLSACAKFKG